MNVASAAGLVGERLGREGGNQSVTRRHGPHGLTHGDLAVGGGEQRAVVDRKLLLGRAQFGIILARLQPLATARGALPESFDFYQAQLGRFPEARQYLAQRGIHSPQILAQLRIGRIDVVREVDELVRGRVRADPRRRRPGPTGPGTVRASAQDVQVPAGGGHGLGAVGDDVGDC